MVKYSILNWLQQFLVALANRNPILTVDKLTQSKIGYSNKKLAIAVNFFFQCKEYFLLLKF